MDNFRTEVELKPLESKLSYDTHMLFMGSCFASNIGMYFKKLNCNALVNPFGVLYNPFSIGNALNTMMSNKLYDLDDLSYYNHTWQSFDHHGQFNNEDAEACLKSINDTLDDGRMFLNKTEVLFITFGTAWVYRLAEGNRIVSNCHKYPSKHFKRSLSKVEDIVSLYEIIIVGLQKLNPSLKIILTVSPVRHWKDGANGNQLSKSILHLAIHELVNRFDCVDYFPAYELLLDDLRDYRFYADDMLHPSPLAIEYIRNKFINANHNVNAQQYFTRMTKLNRSRDHRPFNKNAESYLNFVQKTKLQLEQLQKDFPNVSLKDMLRDFTNTTTI